MFDDPAPPTEPSGQAAAPDTSSPAKSAEERKAILDRGLSQAATRGWRIENRSDFQATIAKGKPVHHLLHLILTLVTLGAWAIVWILVAIFGGEKRQLVTVDDFGNITEVKVCAMAFGSLLGPLITGLTGSTQERRLGIVSIPPPSAEPPSRDTRRL